MSDNERRAFRRAIYDALTDEWQTTATIANRIGFEWRPGSGRLATVRTVLYALQIHGLAEQQKVSRPHHWRRPAVAGEERSRFFAAVEREASKVFAEGTEAPLSPPFSHDKGDVRR